jgi:predicted O-linked N-acetylglucosamine transferase (SPINDLY family)
MGPKGAKRDGRRCFCSCNSVSSQSRTAPEHHKILAMTPQLFQLLEAAVLHLQNNRPAAAETLLNQYLTLDNKNPDVYRFLSVAYAFQNKNSQALEHINHSLKLNPSNGIALSNKGNILRALGRHQEAIESYLLASKYLPNYAEVYNNIGNLYQELKFAKESLPYYDRALEIEPNYVDALVNKGNALLKLRSHEESFQYHYKAFTLSPNEKFLKSILLHTKMLLCDWEGLDELYQTTLNDLRAGKKVAEPFGFQGICDSEPDLLLCAQTFAHDHFPERPHLKLGPRSPSQKIRIAYLCGEFRDQATSILMTGVYESHNKEKFEIYALDNGWDDQSPIRKRIESAFFKIININEMTDLAIATLIKELNIDILINLNGYFGDGRQGVFAYKPAPSQINYLGFPGTLGVSYVDYLIADEVVVPPSRQQFYSEKILYLPNSYQANDIKRVISDKCFTRERCGLPETDFVYCCFNNSYKITPNTFDAWMSILHQVPGSVLWLLEDSVVASTNLRKEAAKRGIDVERIIFAKRLPLSEHLARHRLADLFLDTLPYNAHTTASDALWAGLPVLTQIGNTFPGRVAASLLKAVGLPELITNSEKEYEELAVELAKNPAKLQNLKNRLAENRLTAPLFDTVRFTKDLEDLYQSIHKSNLADSKI